MVIMLKRTLILPYPDPSLNPNRKNGKHWSVTKKAKDEAFEVAYYMTKVVYASVEQIPHEPIPLHITFVRKDKRCVDLDNLLASCKPMCDGIAQAMKIDDKLFDPITITRGHDKEKSFTKVEIG